MTLDHLSAAGDRPARPAAAELRFRVLGELLVAARGRPLPLGPVKQRLVLGALLCHPNAAVSVDLLTEAVWGDEPPRSARKNLQAYVSALRKLLGETADGERIVHHHTGYQLRVAPAELDVLRFEELARAGQSAIRLGATAHGAALLREALDLWSGPFLADLGHSELLRDRAERRELRRLAVLEDWAEAELDLGHAPAVTEALAETVAEHPMRERLCAAQMTALFRSGRQSAALAVYDDLRQHLARQLGLQVGPALETLYRGMLDGQGPAGPAPQPSAAATGAAPRAPQTVLPADLPDFTGRREEVARLTALLAGEGRRVVVSGPVGVGKTALAVHVAHRLAGRFPDGCLTVRLRRADGTPRHPTSLLAELCRATGLVGAVPEDEEEAAALWRSWLAGRRLLLVLDDAPDEGGIRHLLPGSGPSAVLVTSRTRLAGLGPVQRLELEPFAAEEAVGLLDRIVGDGRIRADRQAAERIVDSVGRLPLAVRVCGTKLAVLHQLSAAEYAARLDRSPALLDELAAGDLAVRRQLAVWWAGLPAVVRAVLCAFGRLPRPLFTLAEAMAVLGCGEEVARRVLDSMIEVSVLHCRLGEVTAHAALYEIPLLAQLYARERAAAERPAREPYRPVAG
ncbi:AfsR/SARP family transcriptional regulator [Kitasatospora arboriphila]|uniref:OmpR/PhoB-type domain-containing protein n=1 Tax=Kitasatospora arboriphila TaxID=258052 RepID=A0ABN1U5Y3_9ACTN